MRAENSQRILAEHGVSRFVTRNGRGSDEPWQLDLLPVVLGSEEWRELERGLIQRARLLNLILCDLYGIQRLVRNGFLPAPLLFANPGYLRPCQGIPVTERVYLQTYAADLGRSPDGRWWVLADRTQAPTGLGFALENRSVMARVLPEAMRDVQPRPVLDTLRIRREALRRFSPPDADNPSIVMLTPGQRNEAHFEHAYLSRLLGLTLVEGNDLTVRDRRLYIKTLEGLRGVDVVLRHVRDDYCDPLELRGDSVLGVPGLVETARAGQLSIGNALGTGLLESPAFLPFLPGLCRQLLGEELRLPSLATWWCGQALEQIYVREHLGQLQVRPAFKPSGPTVVSEACDAAERAWLSEMFRISPHEFVGQEQVCLSRTPLWGPKQGTASQPFVLRLFVLHDGQEFTVMPGGLARVVKQERMGGCRASLSGISKDVWVLPDPGAGAQLQVSRAAPPALARVPSDLPSRTADNFFWLGRYTERLEQTLRAARYALGCLLDDEMAPSQRRIGPLEKALGRLGLVATPSAPNESRETLGKEILILVFQDERAGGVRDLLQRIQFAAFSVRDRLSADTWRVLNRLEADSRQRPGRLPLVQASGVLHTLVLDLAALSGMEMENMTRGHGWVFLDLGRRIERGMFVARLIESVWVGGGDLELLLEPALEIADSVMTHRRRYYSEPRIASVVEVLLQDAANPRSLAFQISALRQHAAALPPPVDPEGAILMRVSLGEIEARLGALNDTFAGGSAPELPGRPELLAGLNSGLEKFSELVTLLYFSHVPPREAA